MNIAFPAFFILVLIIPGFIFQNAYEKIENTNIQRKTFDVASSLGIFYALILHMFLIYCVVPFFGYEINYKICLKLLTNSKLISASDLNIISVSIPAIFSYISSSFLFAYLLGKFFQKLIFSLNPYKSSQFAFDTPWYYELKGQLSETENAQVIKLSCLVESKNEAFLFYGILEDFYLDPDGQLDRVVLSDARRRRIESDNIVSNTSPDSSDTRFYKIKGERLILKYENINNINVEYLYIEEIDN